MAQSGIQGGRLVIAPFELTEDGRLFDWNPLDAALGIMDRHGLKTDLSVGPIDFPYDQGARLPVYYQERIKHELVDKGNRDLTISLSQDSNAPQLSADIRDYSFDYLHRLLDRYGQDPRIDKIYLANEYPDTDSVEGVPDARITLAPDFMLEAVKITQTLTDKKIALNTNIHPSDNIRLRNVFKPIYQQLGSQGVLGIDAYPTREREDPSLNKLIPRYDKLIDDVQKMFPDTDLNFTELQAEPWPPPGIAGLPWAEIYQKYPDMVIKDYYQKSFPPTLESYVIAGGMTEIGIWGAELWPVVSRQDYDFPLRMLDAVSTTMSKSK